MSILTSQRTRRAVVTASTVVVLLIYVMFVKNATSSFGHHDMRMPSSAVAPPPRQQSLSTPQGPNKDSPKKLWTGALRALVTKFPFPLDGRCLAPTLGFQMHQQSVHRITTGFSSQEEQLAYLNCSLIVGIQRVLYNAERMEKGTYDVNTLHNVLRAYLKYHATARTLFDSGRAKYTSVHTTDLNGRLWSALHPTMSCHNVTRQSWPGGYFFCNKPQLEPTLFTVSGGTIENEVDDFLSNTSSRAVGCLQLNIRGNELFFLSRWLSKDERKGVRSIRAAHVNMNLVLRGWASRKTRSYLWTVARYAHVTFMHMYALGYVPVFYERSGDDSFEFVFVHGAWLAYSEEASRRK
eukprot:PhM_4_TR14250/c0_g1_i1/m.8640